MSKNHSENQRVPLGSERTEFGSELTDERNCNKTEGGGTSSGGKNSDKTSKKDF